MLGKNLKGVTTCHDRSSAALLIGFSIQGLAIARSLKRAGIPVYVLIQRSASTSGLLKHPVYHTDNITFLYSGSLRGSPLVEQLLYSRGKIRETTVVLFPVTDDSVSTICSAWRKLREYYTVSWSHCMETVGHVLCKTSLPELCERALVDFPKTVSIDSGADIQRVVDCLEFPVLVKPDRQNFVFKTHLCHTEAEFLRFAQQQRDVWPLVAQEWIEGGDQALYFYMCFAEQGREVSGFTGRKVRASPPAMGIATILETHADDDVLHEGRQILATLGATGPVAMEFKRSPSGRLCFIEANIGRTEYCVDLAIQSGLDLPLMEFSYASGKPLSGSGRNRECIWFDTDKEPFSYLALCFSEKSIRPHGKYLVFPYHGSERFLVRFVAILEIFRKIGMRVLNRLGLLK